MGSDETSPIATVPPPAPLAPNPHSRLRQIIIPLLLIVGLQCWLVFTDQDYGRPVVWVLLAGALAAAAMPPIRHALAKIIDRLRRPRPAQKLGIASCVALFATIYLPLAAWLQHRDLRPAWQDEYSYALQIRMLAHGRLWMPAHPLHDFFDTFQVIVDPVYASMYFPGASLFYVPSIWLGIPFWFVSVLMSAACVALMYLIITELIDGVAGILGSIILLSLPQFRLLGMMAIGHPAIILLGMLMILCWLRWRQSRSMGTALALGIVAGWAAITRPLDAVIVALPIGIDMVIQLARHTRPRRWLTTLGALIAGAAPFLVLQIVFNIGVTGSWHRTPFELYASRDYPGTMLGFHPYDASHRPASPLPQKQKFHDIWTVPAIKQHQVANVARSWMHSELPAALKFSTPHALLVVLLPLSLSGLSTARRRVVWLIFPLWIACYVLYTFALPHYVLVAIPAIVLALLLGAHELCATWPAARDATTVFLTVAIVGICFTQMPPLAKLPDQMMDTTELRTIDAALATLEHAPAVVLFHFPPSANPHQEPVYNIDVVWPDDAKVIRAHDLGDRNREIFDYYAQRQPERAFYRYDRGDGSLQFLGFAKDLGHGG